ncbi:hypothetical protein [Streptomyces sp. NPDC093223]|uniref:hypothetical protein n=1 Tax=Streptomyces sp. NPDC093223 TaxID=3366033 RepID=UPI0037F57977
MSILDLPPMPEHAEPVILPSLLSGLGITPRPVPAWVTDPGLIASIEAGLVDIDADFMAVDQPTLAQIQKRITGRQCFYIVVLRARVAELEQRVAAGRLVAKDLTIRAALRDLLDAIGYTSKEHRP